MENCLSTEMKCSIQSVKAEIRVYLAFHYNTYYQECAWFERTQLLYSNREGKYQLGLFYITLFHSNR